MILREIVECETNPRSRQLFMFVVLFALIGSAVTIVWRKVFGVNEEKFCAVEAVNK